MQTLDISINFSLFSGSTMANLSIITLEISLKLFKSLGNTLLNPKNIFYHVHNLVNLSENDWAH